MKMLITGGTGSLGEVLVKEFCNEYDITFTYNKNKDKALELAREYNVKCVNSEELNTINYDFDVIINNAGINKRYGLVDNELIASYAKLPNDGFGASTPKPIKERNDSVKIALGI